MECPRCHFENMPGLGRCFRCNTLLAAEEAAVEVEPPRMARWRRPIRAMMRRLRRWKIIGSESFLDRVIYVLPEWMRPLAFDEAFSVIISAVPGLGHVLQKRPAKVRWYLLIWAVLLTAGIVVFGTDVGIVLLSAAVGVHAFIAVHACLWGRLDKIWKRILAFVIAMGYIWLVYGLMGRVLLRDYTGGRTALTVPAQEVVQGDYLLGRISAVKHPLRRGCMVQVRLEALRTGFHPIRDLLSEGTMYVQVVGLPGEKVQVSNEGYVVDGVRLEEQAYPVPSWLRERSFSFTIPERHYFLSTEYEIFNWGRGNVYNQMIRRACVHSYRDVGAVAVWHWRPFLSRLEVRE